MAKFVDATFTVGSYTVLGSYTGETGATFTLAYGDTTNKGVQNSGYLVAAGNSAMYAASGTPGGADYEVHAWQTYRGVSSGDFQQTGPALRIATDNGYAAWVREDLTQVQLCRIDAGSRNIIATASYTPPSSGTTIKLTIKATGSTLKVLIDDVEKISQTDSTYSAAGKAGVHLRTAINAGDFGGTTQGWPITTLEAWDVAGASITLQQVERGRGVLRGLGRGL